jgi:hypothetical protein
VLIDWNFMWNNLVIVNTVVYQNCAPKMIKQADTPKPWYLLSDAKPNQLALAPVATINVSAV